MIGDWLRGGLTSEEGLVWREEEPALEKEFVRNEMVDCENLLKNEESLRGNGGFWVLRVDVLWDEVVWVLVDELLVVEVPLVVREELLGVKMVWVLREELLGNVVVWAIGEELLRGNEVSLSLVLVGELLGVEMPLGL